MRISTQTVFAQATRYMSQQESAMLQTGQQIAAGRRVLTPSDDPTAASQAVQVAQAQAIANQYTASRVTARNALALEESVLGSVTTAVTSARTLIVEAANGTLSDADRVSLASQLEGIYHTVLGQANATDGSGNYLFGGYQNQSPPFVAGADGGITYQGDDRTQALQVDASRQMATGDVGSQIFQQAPTATGLEAVAGAGNRGSVTFAPPGVLDAGDPDFGHSFTIQFHGTGDAATYTVKDAVTGAETAAATYVPGQAITYGGMQVTLTGEPADADEIQVGQARNQNTDLFATFQNAIQALRQPAGTPASEAALRNVLDNALVQFGNSLDNVLTVRASVGARLDELGVIDNVASDRQIQYAQTKSDLVDLDYTTAISRYSLQQVGLQAAQKAFQTMTQMSLFSQL